jgi:hypothetical protein
MPRWLIPVLGSADHSVASHLVKSRGSVGVVLGGRDNHVSAEAGNVTEVGRPRAVGRRLGRG